MSSATRGDPQLVLQESTGSWTPVQDGLDLGLTSGSTEPAPLVADDFDADGDIDVLAYVPSAHVLDMIANAALSRDSKSPSVSPVQLTEDMHHVVNGSTYSLDLSVDLTTALANATHLEVTVWQHDEDTGGPKKDAFKRVLVPKTSSSMSARVPFDTEADASRVSELETREVVLGSSGEYIAVGPSRLTAFCANGDKLGEFIADQSIDIETFVAVDWVIVNSPLGAATFRVTTGIVPLGDVPVFEDDEDPVPDTKVPNPKPAS
jgi:hypothetical protein